MIGVLLFLNSRGDVVLSRAFRDGFSVRGLAESFRNRLLSTGMAERSPINIVDGLCFVHLRFQDLYVVLASDGNGNCFASFQFMLHLLEVCHAYLEDITEETLKDNFVALLELIDEMMDFGYPQTTEPGLLQTFVGAKGIDAARMKRPAEAEGVTTRLTGKTPWRSSGLWYRVNEVFVDVLEELYVLVSQTGQVLESNIAGRVVVKSFLSGMPECRLVLSDEVGQYDASYHACVSLQADRTLAFVPLDGVFLLMRYRAALAAPPPLKVLHTRFTEVSKTRTEVEFGLKCEIAAGLRCDEVEVRIPCPENTADVKVNVARGHAKFDGVQHAVIWTLPSVSRKDEEMLLAAEIVLLAPTVAASEQAWARPPIKISFTTPSHALSGFSVKELRVEEPLLRYTPSKWVRYLTTAGQYEWRL
ncbi:putative clathrin coat assembly protein [Trypanosoma conorhini]|uniref:Putative clathrin coat assembly protein n=1 Tax=Trypanosoma conorhini TaxID=83891 RepID=A0A3R7MGS1_9TRYP|nr:putative clathrin coat assembly protein [Trypanosoma conorhini]RNF14864.1 putative clathrin coat assembly protein [Trypanosoma conorhini]